MVKHTQTIRPQQPTNSLSVSDHFVGLALEGLILFRDPTQFQDFCMSELFDVFNIMRGLCAKIFVFL